MIVLKTHKGDLNNHLKTLESDLLNLLFRSHLLTRRATVRDSLWGSERLIGVPTPKKERKEERKKERKKERKNERKKFSIVCVCPLARCHG